MSLRLAELCTIFVENAFGELAAHIFSTLAQQGRLSIPQLQRETRLPLRRLKNGLAILSEHHVLLHYAADEDEPTYLEVDWHSASTLIRIPKVNALVADRYGEAAGQIIANVLQLGLASIGDLAGEYDFTSHSKRDSGIDTIEQHGTANGPTNGIARDDNENSTPDGTITRLSQFHDTVRSLLKDGFLIKVATRSYVPHADLEEQIKEVVIFEGFPDRKITGPKKKAEFEAAVNNLKRKWQEEDEYKQSQDIESRGTIKPFKASPSSNKRAKLNGGALTNGVHREPKTEDDLAECSVPRLPNDMLVRVNFTKGVAGLRSQRLERMASRFLGPITAAVYGAMLRAAEGKVKGLRETSNVEENGYGDEAEEEGKEVEPRNPALVTVTDDEIYELLDKSLDLASTIKGAAPARKLPNGTNNHRNKHKIEPDDDDDDTQLGIKREFQSDSEDEAYEPNGIPPIKARTKRMNLIDMHLQILAEHPKHFCLRRSASSHESRIDFPALTKSLLYSELDTMIEATFGKLPVRLIRMLREKGKLDEKQIAGMSMLRISEIRTTLTKLAFAGLVEVQELPKDAARQPSRALYLWYFDEERVRGIYVQTAYVAIARLLQRLGVERGKKRALIEKAEGGDVKGREHEVLGVEERVMLRDWREVEERLLGQVGRLDGLVAVLRDFVGGVELI